MQAGAAGISFGLIYPPGSYADEDECTRLCKVVARYSGVFSIHVRNETDQVIQSVESVIRMAEEAGIRGVISHHKVAGSKNRGKSQRILELVDQAAARGVELFLDQYPYTASATGLHPMLPDDLLALGVKKLISMLGNNAAREGIKAAMDKVVSMEPGGDTVRAMVDYVMIGNCSSNPEYSGRMVKDIAAEKGIPPLDLVLNILRDDKLETDAIYYSTLFYTHVLETMTQRDTAHLFYGKSEVPLLQRRRDP